MKDEIKEILDNFEKYEARYRLHDETQFIITHREIQILLDYITNLQEENERLKELCDKYEEEHNTAFKLWTMKMEQMPTYEEKIEYLEYLKNENERLNNIIDEAIEYIQNHQLVFELSTKEEIGQWFNDFYKNVINILNGGYKE